MKRIVVPILAATIAVTAGGGFAAAAPSTNARAHSGVKGTVLYSPVCPVEMVPPDPQCAPRPGPAEIKLLRRNGSVVAEGDAGADGRFLVWVRPGHYRVEATEPPPGAPGRGCEAIPSEVTVTAGSYVTVDVRCDTGIR